MAVTARIDSISLFILRVVCNLTNIVIFSNFVFYSDKHIKYFKYMSDKLQELTEKLYLQGLSKGKEEGDRILARAKEEADALIAKAREEAASIISGAEKEAEDLKAKVTSDLKMASGQCLQATKKDIETLVVEGIADVKPLSDPEFLKEIIKAVAERFSAQESTDLSIILPASLQDKLEPWIAGKISENLKGGVQAEFSKKISGGFTIGPKDGGYFISLTDGTFKELISGYLRPVTRKLLFGE